MNISTETVPVLRRGVRRQFDTSRNAAILMAPERIVLLDEIADAIILECNHGGCVGEISAQLAARFDAPRDAVEADVIAFLQDLSDKGLIIS